MKSTTEIIHNGQTLAAIVEGHGLWRRGQGGKRADLSGADLSGADLSGATLSGVDLTWANLAGAKLAGADLAGAYLTWATLSGATLAGADLTGAYLTWATLAGADLSGADLAGAYLAGAYLAGAYLAGANLTGAVLPTGETWEEYLSEEVPAFLTSGGKRLSDAPAEVWDGHEWGNCPVSWAFECDELAQVPALHRPRAAQFLQLWDNELFCLDAGEFVPASREGQL